MKWCMERVEGQEIQSHIEGAHLEDLALLLADTMKDQLFALVVYKALGIHARRRADAIAGGRNRT